MRSTAQSKKPRVVRGSGHAHVAMSKLIQSGIYKYIRHPMYTSVSLFGLMCVTATPSIFTWVVFGLLLGILHMKALMEESWMQSVHAEYASYMKHTKRYLPLVF